jgi:hypothetical protein
MNALEFAFYGAGIYYALFIEQVLFIPFLAIVAFYLIASALLKGAHHLSTRKKIMQATWGEPKSPNIIARISVRT